MDKNVVSLVDFRSGEKNATQEALAEKPEEQFSFEDIMKQNKEKLDRMNKERNKANTGVIKSYRLKQ